MKALKLLCQNPIFTRRRTLESSISVGFLKHGGSLQLHGTSVRAEEDSELKDFSEFMDSLKNYEKSGVPKGAGTDSDDGFDLGRMRRLMELLDNPLSKFKVSNYVFLVLFMLRICLVSGKIIWSYNVVELVSRA